MAEKNSIQKVYPWVNSSRIDTISLIGCGGNGSYMAALVARMIGTREAKIKLELWDGDTVEEKNLIRQNFAPSDVGRNKAEALAERYSGAFGIEIAANAKHFEETSRIGELVITCTDNLMSRDYVRRKAEHRYFTWIDLGNEETDGQVVLSLSGYHRALAELDSGGTFTPPARTYRLPNPFELFPNYETQLAAEKLKAKIRASCAEAAEQSPEQVGFVNNMAAAIAMNYVHAVVEKRPINSHMVSFNIGNSFRDSILTKERLSKWMS